MLSISKCNAHIEPIFKTLALLQVIDILKCQELILYYKYDNNLLPYYLQNVPFQLNTSNHATRSRNTIFHMETYARICQNVYTI